MAGTIVHLAVATELNKIFQNEPECYLGEYATRYQPELFFGGNISPDGIMARKNYERSMKLHTHMRDGIYDGKFHLPSNLKIFRERLYKFYKENLERPDRDFSLYLGYLTHMLTDEKFVLEIYNDVLSAIAEAGYDRMDRVTFEKFGADVDAIDFRLVREFPGINTAKEALINVKPYEIAGMITESELTDSRNWILKYFFGQERNDIKKPIFLQYDRMRIFIDDAVDEIISRLPYYIF